MRALASNDGKSKLYLVDSNELSSHTKLGRKVFCKFYISSFKDSYVPSFFMLDSGSDISLISKTLIMKLFSKEQIENYKKPCLISIESFSNHTVKLDYNIIIPCKFSISQREPIYLEFSVFSHQSPFPILLGQNLMELLQMELKFPTGEHFETPTVLIHKPYFKKLYVRFIHPSDSSLCFANISLEPNQSKSVIFQPHETSCVRKGDACLISESNLPGIHIFPSKCTAFSSPNKPFIGHVMNLRKTKFVGKIKGKVELLDNVETISTLNEISNLPETNTVIHEVLNFEEHSPFNQHKSFQVLENIPSTKNAITPLTSFLLMTPYESEHIDNHNNNKTNTVQNTPNILSNLEHVQPSLSSQERELFKDKLQNLPFNSNNSEFSDHDSDTEPIPSNITDPQGYFPPIDLNNTIHDIIKLQDFENIHRPYIKNIFIDKYPSVISLHSFDIGSLSDSLGLYRIQLKPGETLPRFRKVYYLAQEQRQHMRTILDFLLKYDIIAKAKADDNGQDMISSPCYLVSRKDKSQSYRLVIDYRLINRIIATPVPIIPDITSTLHSLQNQALFTLFDLSSAFYSLSITEDCQHITSFASPLGKYVFKKAPMGLKSSPAIFQDIALKMLHYKPVLDKDGKPIFSGPNEMKLVWDPISQTTLFFDDLLIYSPLEITYEKTLKKHYELVEKVIQRLALHKAKIGFQKSVFACSHIKYLGWNISNGYIEPDKQRINKLLNASFPVNQKAMRSFTALVNTIKMVCPHHINKPLKILLPLTGSNNKYQPTDIHHEAFKTLQKMLTTTPLFTNIIDPKLPKILFTDASASQGASFSAVLGQVQTLSSDKLIVPQYLSLQDPVHRIIYNKRLVFQPIDIYFHSDLIPKSKLKVPLKLSPSPDIQYLSCPYLGYTLDTVADSLFISIRSIQYTYQCTLLTINEMRKNTLQRASDSLIIKHRILDNQFNNNLQEYKTFANEFLHNQGPLDENLELLKALALSLFRTIIIVSSLDIHSDNPILKYNPNVEKPPFILGLYEKSKRLIFRPYFIDKNSDFDVKQLERFQIAYFYSKIIPADLLTKSILELELMALLLALAALDKLIGKSEILAITDSKSLFLLFANPLHKSSTKIARWSDKLHSDYPNLKLRFLSTKLNIADFLSRNFSISTSDIKRIPLGNYIVPDLENHLDFSKTFSLSEWKTFVNSNLHLLKTISPDPQHKLVLSLNKTVKDINKLLEPVNTLKKRLSFENIAEKQKEEFNFIIVSCIKSEDHTASFDGKNYKYQNGMLFCFDQGIQRLFVPKSLEGLLIAHYHLAFAHAGVNKMQALMYNYYFPQKMEKIKNLAARCHPCALNNMNTRRHKSGTFPLPQNVFTTVYADLAENLNPSGGFQHLLIIVCALSGFLRVYPLKAKTSEQVLYHILYDIFQYFSVKYFVSDNGACFSDKHFLATLQVLGIKKIQIASLSPTSNGLCERNVAIVKKLLKKTLTTFDTYNWNTILPIVLKQYNSSICVKTNYSPLTLLHGIHSPHVESTLSTPFPSKLYPLLENHKTYVEQKFNEKETVLKFVRETLKEQKIATQEKFDKHKITHQFHPGDYVFVKDVKIVLGAPRPLRSYYSSDPYVVLKVKNTTLLLQRLSDGFITIYNMNMIKKYSPLSADFSDLPIPVREILVHSFDKLDKLQFEKLRELGSIDHPTGNILDYELLANTQDEESLDNETSNYPLNADNQIESFEPLPYNNNNDTILDKPAAATVTDQTMAKPAPVPAPESKKKRKIPTSSIKTRSKTNNPDSESESEADENDNKKVTFANS